NEREVVLVHFCSLGDASFSLVATAVDRPSDVASVSLGRFWCRVDWITTPISVALAAINASPIMRPRPRLHQSPPARQRIFNGGVNFLVGVTGHRRCAPARSIWIVFRAPDSIIRASPCQRFQTRSTRKPARRQVSRRARPP